MAKNDSIDIVTKNGKKICKIEAPQGWQSWITIPTLIPFLGVRYVNTWSNPEAVIRFAWFQIHSIVQDIREPSSITEQKGCRCLLCGENSVYPKYVSFRKHVWTSVIGFNCQNKKCQMCNVLIPSRMAVHLHEMPDEIMGEILQQCEGKFIFWTEPEK